MDRAVKLTKAQRCMRAALEFLQDYSDAFRRVAPKGKEDEYAAVWWWPREPSYCWGQAYGDFQPATIRAGIDRGLIERDGTYHRYRITPAGLSALTSKEQNNG